ncbi:MAG: tetratricopeptide repeat protein [Rubrivivax sp.]|nr:tetratricopeptide repeat protein [Rubrivivax sp.]MBK7262482.1 tetratricopeptide repeat protein [Rubrivivax sp.]MBK8527540.1 tetratricopeptide repeat protein [Rubrivivax sp.]
MNDVRGNALGTASASARDAVEKALWRMMSFYDVPMADLDLAIAADPAWPLPHVMKAGFLLSLTEPALVPEAQTHLERARPLMARGTPREQAHFAAVEQVADGRWHGACRIWDELLIDHPRDALALQWGQLWDFYRGDAAGLRLRPARALPAWDEADPLFPCVLALYAFGLEENNLYAQAEEAGRHALDIDARVPWAVHAVAHVMEMQGRFEEGNTWLRQHQPVWAEGNGFAGHLWWHKALFRLEALDVAGALRIVDKQLSGDALQITLQRLDAAAMLWRLHLLGHDMSAACATLLAGWDTSEGSAGYYAFNDVHLVVTMLAAGEVSRAEAWVARCAERALDGADARRANHVLAREVGLPLLRGLLAFGRGEHDSAADALYAVRGQLQRLGGSHAQRDLVDLTLLSAAARGMRRALGQALVRERLMAKPATPMTRHWMDALEML